MHFLDVDAAVGRRWQSGAAQQLGLVCHGHRFEVMTPTLIDCARVVAVAQVLFFDQALVDTEVHAVVFLLCLAAGAAFSEGTKAPEFELKNLKATAEAVDGKR